AFSKTQQQFGLAKRDALPQQCRQCDYLRLCWGECPKNRLLTSQQGEPGLNYLCSGLYRFYQHVGPDVVHILQQLGYLNR
ncbi:MAG: SPASM domain-containing protein, partial [Aeromonadaceae bacterium]